MVGGRVLVQQRRQVHSGHVVVAADTVEGADFRPDSADDEVLEDWRHWEVGARFWSESIRLVERRGGTY